MLPLPNLDDRFFEDIVTEGRKSIPSLLPLWTDENEHDPGITFLELFSWLMETQQYSMNRITEKMELKFLKLMGIQLREAGMAKAEVSFDGVNRYVTLPKGTKLLAKDQSFETERDLRLIPANIDKIVVLSNSESSDFTSSNRNTGVAFYAFGHRAESGNRLYIAFDRALVTSELLSLTVNLMDDYPVRIQQEVQHRRDFVPSALVSWKYYGSDKEDESKTGWFPLELVKDGTNHFSHSGSIDFSIPAPMKPLMVHPANDKGRYWISCSVEEAGYEVPPKVQKISLNTISVIQCDTLFEFLAFDSTGQAGQSFEASDYLTYYGNVRVQVRESSGVWLDWDAVDSLAQSAPDENSYVLQRHPDSKSVTVSFGDGAHGRIPPLGVESIRVAANMPDSEGIRMAGASNGLPNQRFRVELASILPEGFTIQVGQIVPGLDRLAWVDWERISDFDNSKPSDRHFVFDAQSGSIVFGNNERGLIPDATELANIRILACQVGGGERGNVNRGLITTIVSAGDDFTDVTATNHFVASGGSEKETLEEAKARVQRELKTQYRTVTSEDYEQIALGTPGLRVARAKAIPLYVAGLKGYPQNKAPAQITVVIVPFSEADKPIPSKGFLETVRIHLNKHRLITTELHVIPPEYIKITVNGVIVVEPDFKNLSKQIVDAIHGLLQPIGRDRGVEGWEFGRTVYKGDIYGVINQIRGVSYIQDLWLDAQGNGIHKQSDGSVEIPPHGLVYSGDHEIEVISRTDI